MSATRAGQNGMALTGAARSQPEAHELISLKLLLASKAANRFLIGIVRNSGGYIDGWFHDSS
jgi:hypothetical protein